jgi:hypothetical protein
MYKYLAYTALAVCCMNQPLLAQQGYEFLQRDNPFGIESNSPQGAGELAFCWSDVVNRVAYVTNLFPLRTDTKEQLESMLQQNKPGRRFTCEFGRSPALNGTAVRKTTELATRGTVEQLRIGPVGGR